MYPLVARPTEVEWVEMKYDQGRQSTADPTVRVVDMKRNLEWEEAEPQSTFDIMPIEQHRDSRMIVPVNVISITPGKIIFKDLLLRDYESLLSQV